MNEDTTRPAAKENACEAVGVFQNPDALEAAVDALEVSGFDRAAISVLATGTKAKTQIDRFYRTLGALEDSGGATHAAFVSRDSRTAGEAAAVGIPLYVGGFAGAAAAAASGGALALAVAATVAGAAAGAGLGALLAVAIARRHAADVREQLRKGGLVLWVSVADAEAEKRAVAVLEKAGAADIHVHEVKDRFSLDDTPLVVPQADPFLLESDPDEVSLLLRALDVDLKKFISEDSASMRRLQLVCVSCGEKIRYRCQQDLDAGTASRHYRDYCLNASSIDALSGAERTAA